MGVFDSLATVQPSSEQGARRVKQILAQTFGQIERSLQQVCHIMEQQGSKNINADLAEDAEEVKALYMALKAFVEEHKSNTSVPNLPK